MLNNLWLYQFRIKSLKFLFPVALLKLIIIIVPVFGTSYSFEINRLFDDCHPELTKKIDISLDLALKKYDGQKIWLIYSIDSFCTLSNTPGYRKSVPENINLTQLIYGKYILKDMSLKNHAKSSTAEKLNHTPTGHRLERLLDNDRSAKLAVILDYSLESGNPCLYQVYLQNMNQPFVKENRPIFWLGEDIPSASINWLRWQYHRTKYQKLKQQIITAIGAHQFTQPVVDFLQQVVFSNCSLPLKTDAIHSLGKHNSIESIRLLTYLAVKQKNILLRKKAIFALSQVNDKTAQNVVTALANKERNQEVRLEAIFWLSQIADDDALKTLNEILASEKNSTIKNYTLFAISQLPGTKSIPILYHIARSNPDDKIRSKAKFWLHRTKDHRIMNFIKELAQEDNRSGSN